MASTSISRNSKPRGKSAPKSSDRRSSDQVSLKGWIGVMATLLGAFMSEFAV